jgi:hypothetical protein
MQAVYDEYSDSNVTLDATDLYVRVMPQDSTQLETLEELYDLDLFDYPLDLDIPDGEEYIDPTISEGEFGWYYTTIKPDFEFPEDIVYEIIRELYIPEDDEIIEVGDLETRAENPQDIIVEEAAFEMLGYDVGLETRSGGGGGQRAQGYVTVLDHTGTEVPVVGIRVKVNSHTKIDKEVYTNASGFYQTNKKFWQQNLQYTLVYLNKTHDFIIWDIETIDLILFDLPLLCRAKHKITQSKYGGDINLTAGTVWRWAAIYKAACDYYTMCNETGITTPPEDLKILCSTDLSERFDGSSAIMSGRLNYGSGAGSLRRAVIDLINGYDPDLSGWAIATVLAWDGPDLVIDATSDSYRYIYEVTNHELSHASHYNKVGASYWEQYVRYIINSVMPSDSLVDLNTYGDGTGQYAGICEVGEMWGITMGHVQECEKHNETRLDDVYFNYYYWNGSWDNSPDYFRRAGDEVVEGDGGWIKPDPIWALITRGVLTKKQVFDCLTWDVDTVEELRAKMCTNYSTKVGLINLAFTANDTANPIIEGPSDPALNTLVTYTVPPLDSVLPEGMALDSFTVSGDATNRSISGSPEVGYIFVTFYTAMAYTITATYSLPDDTEYVVTKTIDLTPPPPPPIPPTPEISAQSSAIGGHPITATAFNIPASFGGTYEWNIIGGINPINTTTTTNSITFVPILSFSPSYDQTIPIACVVRIRCRTHAGTQYSAWSSPVSVFVSPGEISLFTIPD